jgi:hypothetical protein
MNIGHKNNAMTTDQLLNTMQTSIVMTELSHTQIQVRALMALLLISIFFQLVDPAVYILTVDTSFYHKLALALGHPNVLAMTFCLPALALLPHLVAQVRPAWLTPRRTAKLACFGLFAAGAQWIFLSSYIWHWDVPSIAGVFLRLGIGCIIFSLSIALALNAELARKYTEPT